MITLNEVGHFALALALASAVLMAALGLCAGIGKTKANPALLLATRRAAIVFAGQVALSFIILTIAFIRSDFSVKLVADHSHSLKPMLYKISGVWGNHEGSLLLWILILGIFAVWVARARGIDAARRALVLAVQGMIAAGFTAFMLLTSNPFIRLDAPPPDGRGLNPLLQDPGLALHPPMLYFGYVGLSVAFGFAVAALIEGRADKNWARELRGFVMVAWAALTAGIALGSWWAYYELGWGGWWFWDPVENASLMPWLIATALIHSVIVLEKQGGFITWTVLLAILGFALSLLGTFIVRSGLLTSVHAFASDPARGIVILFMLAIAIGAPLILFAIRGGMLSESSPRPAALFSRETALMANNLMLTVATATVLVGTLYPLGLEAWNGARISVGPPFYNATFAPLMGMMVLIMAAAPLIAWQRGNISMTARRLRPALMLAIAGGVAVIFFDYINSGAITINMPKIATIALALWLLGGVAADAWSLRRMPIRKIPRARFGVIVAHCGVAVFMFGIAGLSFYASETIERVAIGEVVEAGNRAFRLDDVERVRGPNYMAVAARLSILDKSGAATDSMSSELRFYPAEGSSTTEAAIATGIFGDAYATLGDGNDNDGYALRVYDKPLAAWIWGGAGLMALGGLIALPAPQKNRRKTKTKTKTKTKGRR